MLRDHGRVGDRLPLLVRRRRIASRAACCGTCLAILAFVTSLFITAIAGIHLNIVHMWTLPFLLVGIGIDDMFIIVSAARAARREAKDLEQLLREVCAPVSMTSIVNGAMFAMMLLSDLNADQAHGADGAHRHRAPLGLHDDVLLGDARA